MEIRDLLAHDPNEPIKLNVTRKLELSKDGSKLTETSVVSGPPGMLLRNSAGNGGAPKRIFSRVK